MSTVIDRKAIDTLVEDTLVDFGVDRDRITPEASFDELEVDSLDIVELHQTVKNRLGVNLKVADFDTIETIGEALSLIYRRAGLE
ncbi:acyl carrier protein [Actinokineospora sp. 24-640]